MSGGKKGEKASIVIRKEEVVEGGHHGGAWKVAYADFVTAMMAFFLLMWLLNATTQEQRRGLADYFSPNSLTSRTNSGFGAPFGGLTPNLDGSLASDRGAVQVILSAQHPNIETEDDAGDTPAQSRVRHEAGPAPRPTAQEGNTTTAEQQGLVQPTPLVQGAAPNAPVPAQANTQTNAQTAAALTDQALQAEAERRERQAFERAAQQIRDAVRTDPALADLAKQLAIDITPEGLRIQILDEDRTPMFATGSAALNERARAVLAKIAPVLLRLPENLAIAGHTDGAAYRGGERSNWDLSADRANATRRLLVEAGVPEARMRSVTGNADRDPLLPDRMAAANRRIAILVLRTPAPGR